ncbi:TPA: hypothetical protein MH291_23950 [Klebsiella pneumoniae]|nr:hypothetical protein [Klebsiella pneumoniae]
MVLHEFLRPVTPFAALSRRGLSPLMYLHENRPTKQAGEAGKVLRTKSGYLFFLIRHYTLSNVDWVLIT